MYSYRQLEKKGGRSVKVLLEEKRKVAGFSQDEVARKLKITTNYYNLIVNGHRRPSPDLAKEIGKLLKFDWRSEEHTSELQSRFDLVCRLLLEKKKKLEKTTI